MTQKRATVDALLQENAELRARYSEAEATIAALREAERRKDNSVTQLVHEIRSPLAPLLNGIEILNRISSKEPASQEIRDLMERQIDKLVRLVDELPKRVAGGGQ